MQSIRTIVRPNKVDDVKAALSGMLTPEKKEERLGLVEAQLVEHASVGLEVREVVLLLQPGVLP